MAKAKRIRGLKCDAPATAGIKQVLLTRLGELQSWRDTALDWSDPEGVHSMRVASRRLRSALRDFLPYVHKRRLAGSMKQLKKVADALGGVRDHDVAIIALEEIKSQAPAEISAALGQFIETRASVRERARQELTAAIETDELKRLETRFVAAVEGAIAVAHRPKKHAQDKPPLAFAEMSRKVILDRLKEFEKRSEGLFRPLDIDALHDMRIAVKRLRYALELFSKCWPRVVGAQARRAARIQTALGDLHDCDVWIAAVGKQIIRARKQKEQEQAAALLWLLNHFLKLRTKHLQRAFTRWREWEKQDASGKVRAALETPKPPEPSEPELEPPPPPQIDQAGGE
ncbi:MAG TPA: CHAD domain-containing protein, partial [Pyrinomonadaceae bacterium]|nr:CHAD domain-containing protein [Pyrinomonadaceae bacterium]